MQGEYLSRFLSLQGKDIQNYDGTLKYSSFNPATNIWPDNTTSYRVKVNANGSRSELVMYWMKSRKDINHVN